MYLVNKWYKNDQNQATGAVFVRPHPGLCGMTAPLFTSTRGATLVGAGHLTRPLLAQALGLAPDIVAVDGGANRVLALGYQPDCVLGDMDSITPATRAQIPPNQLHSIAEQDTTDFSKALRSVAVEFILAVGFSGPAMDHALAAFHALTAHPWQRCILLGQTDLCFLAPPHLTLRLPIGTRFSLFPMGRGRACSAGLRWPLDGLDLAPDGQIGTSNETNARQVDLSCDAPTLLVILPKRALRSALTALNGPMAARWPERRSA